MKEPDMEGVASHHGPESCAGNGNAAGEALTGVRAGQPLSSEIKRSGVPTVLTRREGHAGRRAHREWRPGPTESKTLCMRGNSMHEAIRAAAVIASGGPAPFLTKGRRPCACAETLCTRTGRSQWLPQPGGPGDGRGRPVAATPTCTPLGSQTSA